MKKFTLFFCLISAFSFSLNAQEVISTTGDFDENTSASLSWTIGEVLIETYTGSSILTQGFHQTNLSASSIFENETLDFSIKIYPNPTPDRINLLSESYEDLSFQVFDYSGKLLKEDKIISKLTVIDFIKYPSAVYFLKINEGVQLLKTFQIIKN